MQELKTNYKGRTRKNSHWGGKELQALIGNFSAHLEGGGGE